MASSSTSKPEAVVLWAPVLLALLFYVAFPMAGAFVVRGGWRGLRRWLTAAAASPVVTFRALQEYRNDSGPFRLIGSLEAFEGRDTLWIGNEQVSVQVRIRGVEVYFLEHPDEGGSPQEPPRKVNWTNLGVLPEGTRFLIWGYLSTSSPIPLFESKPGKPLLVLAFHGDETTVLERTLRDSRQVIEHWNPVTPISLLVGFGTLLLVAYWELRFPGSRALGLSALALALLPSTFFLPPGIFLFYWFSKLWAESRTLRATRDVLRFRGDAPEKALSCGLHARRLEILAHAVLAAGAGLNVFLLVTLLRLTIL